MENNHLTWIRVPYSIIRGIVSLWLIYIYKFFKQVVGGSNLGNGNQYECIF